MLGAVIHPKNYILPLLRPHFCGRFPEENFMIYDAVHQAVLLQEDHKARLLELAAPLELPPPSEREQQFQALWKQFYQTLEIKARHNEKCRMTHCPKRFWADMVEMKDEFNKNVASAALQPPKPMVYYKRYPAGFLPNTPALLRGNTKGVL